MDRDLRPALDSDFDGVDSFAFGLAGVCMNDYDLCGYIDTTGWMRLLLPYAALQPFDEFGLALVNHDLVDWNIDVIDRSGKPRLKGFESADFSEGDFPYFELTKKGKESLYDTDCRLIFSCGFP